MVRFAERLCHLCVVVSSTGASEINKKFRLLFGFLICKFQAVAADLPRSRRRSPFLRNEPRSRPLKGPTTPRHQTQRTMVGEDLTRVRPRGRARRVRGITRLFDRVKSTAGLAGARAQFKRRWMRRTGIQQ